MIEVEERSSLHELRGLTILRVERDREYFIFYVTPYQKKGAPAVKAFSVHTNHIFDGDGNYFQETVG